MTADDDRAAEPIVVSIPGPVLATFEGGRVTSIAFSPSASDAGYFGPKATLWDGDGGTFNLEDVDGAFWQGVRDYLASGGAIEWTE